MEIVADPTNPATVYAATDGGGVFKSENGGTTWQPKNAGLNGNLTIVALALISKRQGNPATLYTSRRNGGVFRSTSGGDAWVSAKDLTLQASTIVSVLAVDTCRFGPGGRSLQEY